MAEYMCKVIKLSEKKEAGDLSVEVEMKKLETEADSILKELKIKNSSAIDQLKFQEAVKKEFLKCEQNLLITTSPLSSFNIDDSI